MIGYLDKDIKPLVLIMSKMSRYFKTFKFENKINKLMSFCVNDEKLIETYKAIWTDIKNLKRFKLNALSVYDDRYIKTKIRTYGDKVDTNFRGLNVTEDDIECKSFITISINSLIAYNKTYYLQVYLENCVYKIVNKQMADYLDENRFED